MVYDPDATTETFTPAPRNLDQAVLVFSNSGGTNTLAQEIIDDILTDFEILAKQARQTLGEYLWDTYF